MAMEICVNVEKRRWLPFPIFIHVKCDRFFSVCSHSIMSYIVKVKIPEIEQLFLCNSVVSQTSFD